MPTLLAPGPGPLAGPARCAAGASRRGCSPGVRQGREMPVCSSSGRGAPERAGPLVAHAREAKNPRAWASMDALRDHLHARGAYLPSFSTWLNALGDSAFGRGRPVRVWVCRCPVAAATPLPTSLSPTPCRSPAHPYPDQHAMMSIDTFSPAWSQSPLGTAYRWLLDHAPSGRRERAARGG